MLEWSWTAPAVWTARANRPGTLSHRSVPVIRKTISRLGPHWYLVTPAKYHPGLLFFRLPPECSCGTCMIAARMYFPQDGCNEKNLCNKYVLLSKGGFESDPVYEQIHSLGNIWEICVYQYKEIIHFSCSICPFRQLQFLFFISTKSRKNYFFHVPVYI